ncbi:MAG: V-type ATP synthase subunit A [Promethearchaeota archaeon]
MNNIAAVKNNMNHMGEIIGIDGPVIKIRGLKSPKIGDMVKIGYDRRVGEIVKIFGNVVIAQCYDYTDGLKIREPVENTNLPLSMELAPGLLNKLFDGIQRPLDKIGDFIGLGAELDPLSRTKKWKFIPQKKIGDKVKQGDILAVVEETKTITHKIMVPVGVEGVIESIQEGDFTIVDDIYTLKMKNNQSKSFQMLQKWPIRRTRPFIEHLFPNSPLITGQRVIDLLFPIAKGGTVAIPGGFGTGKTVLQHNLAKYADANIIVYIGCGERGNELTDILSQFPELIDPHTNRPLMERTVLIGNTSNMPVSAREASIFSGLTIAEYYRDMGYDVCLLADSTSRWAEALRELSARLEEMPAEGGYPAYLATRLASFYERAGMVRVIGSPKRYGSLTIVGAVSPPSGDFSEPVTKTTRRFVRGFWALDPKLAYSRHYPSINWSNSYSLYEESISDWWHDNVNSKWREIRAKALEILSRSDELENIVQLVGVESLPVNQRLTIMIADLIKRAFLIQSAFDEVDAYSSPQKTMCIIDVILHLAKRAEKVIDKVPIFRITELDVIEDIERAKSLIKNDELHKFKEIHKKIDEDFDEFEQEYQNILETQRRDMNV